MPNHTSEAFRSILVYFANISRYKTGMAKFNGTKSPIDLGTVFSFQTVLLTAAKSLNYSSRVIECFSEEVPKHRELFAVSIAP